MTEERWDERSERVENAMSVEEAQRLASELEAETLRSRMAKVEGENMILRDANEDLRSRLHQVQDDLDYVEAKTQALGFDVAGMIAAHKPGSLAQEVSFNHKRD